MATARATSKAAPAPPASSSRRAKSAKDWKPYPCTDTPDGPGTDRRCGGALKFVKENASQAEFKCGKCGITHFIAAARYQKEG